MTAKRSERPHVVIIGAGFAGLYAARELADAPVRITLVDRHNYHLFQPLLYQVATASLSPADIASPIRGILGKQQNLDAWLGEARDVDVAERTISLEDGRLSYDYLIVATGATDSYFGHDEWAPFAQGLKSVDDALEIRRSFLLAFEAAEREADAAARHRLLTSVIVGAGPTGVELAGAMAEIARKVMPRDFRFIDTATTRIVLLEAAPRVLPAYPPELSEKARAQLERLGVEVHTGRMVTDITDAGVRTDSGEFISAENVYWAAGVQATPLGASLGAPTDKGGHVHVEPDLSVPRHPEIFVAGDLAHIEQDGEAVPGIAPAAMQMGRHAARSVLRDLEDEPRRDFRYRDKGLLATIGRGAAVARIGRLKFSGFIAWMLWVLVHIFYLIGFRNRILVMLQWAWAYITYQRGIRLITGEPKMRLRTARGRAASADSGHESSKVEQME